MQRIQRFQSLNLLRMSNKSAHNESSLNQQSLLMKRVRKAEPCLIILLCPSSLSYVLKIKVICTRNSSMLFANTDCIPICSCRLCSSKLQIKMQIVKLLMVKMLKKCVIKCKMNWMNNRRVE